MTLEGLWVVCQRPGWNRARHGIPFSKPSSTPGPSRAAMTPPASSSRVCYCDAAFNPTETEVRRRHQRIVRARRGAEARRRDSLRAVGGDLRGEDPGPISDGPAAGLYPMPEIRLRSCRPWAGRSLRVWRIRPPERSRRRRIRRTPSLSRPRQNGRCYRATLSRSRCAQVAAQGHAAFVADFERLGMSVWQDPS